MHLFSASSCLVLFYFVISVLGNFQPYYEGFEQGSSFQLPAGQSNYTAFVISPGAQSTQKALRLTGGQTSSFDGPYVSFPDAAFYSVSFWVKTGVVGNVGGVAFSSGTIDDVMMQFQFFATGQFGITSKTSTLGITNYSVDTWYYIIFDVNWVAKTYDFYVNNKLVATNAELLNSTAESISIVSLFNSDSFADSYYDEIRVGCPGGCSGYSCNTDYATCECSVAQACESDCSQVVMPLSLFVLKPGTLPPNQSQFYSYDNSLSPDVRFSLRIRVYNGSVDAQLYGGKVTGPAFCASSDRYTQTSKISTTYTFELSSCTSDTYTSIWSMRLFSELGALYSLEVIDGPQELYNNIAKQRILSTTDSKFVFHVPANVNGMAQLVLTVQNTSQALSPLSVNTLISNTTCAAAGVVQDQTTSNTVNGYLQLAYTVTGGERYTFDILSTDFNGFFYNLVATLSNCVSNCNNNGVCLNSKCFCNQNMQQFAGSNCGTYACPESCNLGTCYNGTCSCPAGYSGAACSCSGKPLPTGANVLLLPATYSIDLSPFASGADLVANISSGNAAIKLQGCSASPSYAISTTRTGVFSAPISPCLLREIGSPAVILQVSGNTGNSTLAVKGANYGVGAALPGAQGLYFASHVQAISNFPNFHILNLIGTTPFTVSIKLVGYQSSSGAFAIYVSNSSCPSSTNYLFSASSATTNVTTQITYTPSSPSDKLYFNVVNSLDFLSFYDLNTTVSNCNQDCSGQGVCFNGSCRCYKFFTGQHCEIALCASDCNGNGVCVKDAICKCNTSYSGKECPCRVDGALVAGNGVGGQVSRTDRYRRYSVDSSLSSFGFRVDFMSNSTAAFTLLVASNLDCYTEGGIFDFMDTGTTSRQYACGLSYPSGGNWVMTVDGNQGNSNYSLSVTPNQPVLLKNAYRVLGVQATPVPQYFQYNLPSITANSNLTVVVTPSTASSLLSLYISASPCPSFRNYLASATQRGTTANLVATVMGLQNQSVYLAVYSLVDSPPFPQFSIRLEYDTKDCTAGCGAGVCANGVCNCYYGYSGQRCNTQICNNDCSGHGTCTTGNTCRCASGYYGANNCKCTLLGNLTQLNPTSTLLAKNSESYTYGLDLTGLNHTKGWLLTSSSPMSFYLQSMNNVVASTCPDSSGNYVTNLVNTTYSIVLRPCTPEFNAYSTIEKWVVNLKARLTSQVSLSVSEVAIPQIQQLQLGKMVSGVANALAPSIYQIQMPALGTEKDGAQISFSSSAAVQSGSIRISDSPCPNNYTYLFYNPATRFFPVLLFGNTTYYIMVEINSILDTKFNFSVILQNVSCTRSCDQSGLCVNDECVCFPGYRGPNCEVGCGSLGCGSGNCTGKNTCSCGLNSFGANCNCSVSARLGEEATHAQLQGNTQYYELNTSAYPYGWQASFSYGSANNYDVAGYPITDLSKLNNCTPSTSLIDFNKYKANDGFVGYELLPCTTYYSMNKFLLTTQFTSGITTNRNLTVSVASSAKHLSASYTGSYFNVTVPAKSSSNIGKVMYIVTIGRPYSFTLIVQSSQLCNLQVTFDSQICPNSATPSLVPDPNTCRSKQNFTLDVPNHTANSVFYLWASTNTTSNVNVTISFSFLEPSGTATIGKVSGASSSYVLHFFWLLLLSTTISIICTVF